VIKQSEMTMHEVLIIRRGGNDEAPHKGGAWKIAYADFVTAMMAFFLVMWLINSANEVTKARVASYFNPIKMTDAAPMRRGLKETTDAQSPNTQSQPDDSAESKGKTKDNAKPTIQTTKTFSDSDLLMNPFPILDELVQMSKDDDAKRERQQPNSNTGDPFNPRAFESLHNGIDSSIKQQQSKNHENGEKFVAVESAESTVRTDMLGKGGDKAQKSSDLEPSDASFARDDRELAAELRQAVAESTKAFGNQVDFSIQVEVTQEGVLVVLADASSRSMFSSGSAQPNPVLIEIIGNIGALLSQTTRPVIIRGHTDGRQFRNRKYDNWQLSTDRAHMASYMLMRGGLSEARIARVEGYGSSKPVLEGQFFLDANRRVEFLLPK
jgi:chemotaxis protein MotB